MTEDVLDRLVEYIAAGDTPQQRMLPEHALCESLGVSRSALREALSALGHLGIIKTQGKVRMGSTVAARAYLLRRAAFADSPIEVVEHALEARSLLEPPLAALAAERATAEDLRSIRRFLDLMEQCPDGPELIVEYDSGFHVSIARASGNTTLVYMVSAIADSIASTRTLSLHAPGGTQASIAGHHAIVDALDARDSARAEDAMREHLDDVARLIRMGPERASSM